MYKFTKRTASGCLLSLIALLSGCSANDTDTQSAENTSTHAAPTVSVEKRQIIPTLSAKATVEQAVPFILSTPQRGEYRPAVKVNDLAKANQVLGWSNGREIKTPVDAVVRRVAEPSEDLPAFYPVFELEYRGFALRVDASMLLTVTPIESLTGKFQVQNGIGPTEIKAIVASPSNPELTQGEMNSTVSNDEVFHSANPMTLINATNPGDSDKSKDHFAPQDQAPRDKPNPESAPRVASQTLLCLIEKDLAVRPGQAATVVLAGQAKANVLATPISSVAGRTGKGFVTLRKNGGNSLTEVSLGVSDGAYIEIISGLSEGDVISAVAPYIDPRKK